MEIADVDSRLGGGQLPAERCDIGCRSTRAGNVLGIHRFYRQFVDLHLIGAQEAEQHFRHLSGVRGLCPQLLKVDIRHQHILFWDGLRGALALALALALPAELPQHDAIVTLSFALVAFSVFAQGLTITPLLRRLGQIK